MKIVVTGALGHIGSYLIRELPDLFPSSEIILIDNFATQRYVSLFNLPKNGIYQFVEADVTKDDLFDFFKEAQVVVHLAAMTDATGSLNNAELFEKHNFHATAKVADSCVKTGSRLIMVSSTSVYGSQNKSVSENCSESQLNPQSPYALTKLKEEKYIKNLSKTNKLKSVICRFGTIFGVSPGMRFHTAVNKFCWQAAMGLPVTVWKTAYEQKRPYLDLKDAVSAIELIINNDLFQSDVINVLSSNLSVQDVIEQIKVYFPKLEIKFVENEIMNQLSYNVSNDKLLKLGFHPRYDLQNAIESTCKLMSQASSLIK